MKEQKNTGKKIAAAFRSRRSRQGSFSAVLCVAALVVVVAVNLVVGMLPASLTQYDLSASGLYTLSDQTETTVENLEEDVTLYLLSETGYEDETLLQLLERYASLSSHISVETVDPVLHPGFAAGYTDTELSSNSVIVAGETRSRAIDYYDIYVYDYMAYYYYGTTDVEFDGEGQITSAIDYVANGGETILYSLTGHGEAGLPEALASEVEKRNMELHSLNLLTEEAVPEDADCLLLLSPASDISPGELEKVTDYLDGGGRLLLLTNYTETELPELAAFMEGYGLQAAEGIVIEGDSSRCVQGYQHYLLPLLESHSITSAHEENNYNVVMPLSQGLTELESYRSTLTIEPLLSTSEQAYSKPSGFGMTVFEKEEGDTDGPFLLGALVREDYQGTECEIVWYSSGYLLDAAANQLASGGNYSLFLNTLSYLCDEESSISIAAKSITDGSLVLSSAQSTLWSLVLTVCIPLLILAAGLVIWLRRRRK